MEPWDLNLRHLRAFVLTARLGSIVAAARAVNLSQPAVTQAIGGLEMQIGLSFFERRTDGMVPLLAAKLLLPRAESALQHIESNRVTSAQARALIALASGGSYVQASFLTGLSPATLHRSISDLEIGLGRTLVSRRGRGVELNVRGRTLARRFRLAAAELRAALEELATLKGGQESRLNVGAMPLCRERLLPATVVDFQSVHPAARIGITEGSFAELIEPLRDGELDLLIGALREPSPGPDVVQTPLFEDSPVVLARRQHPLAKSGRMASIASLAKYPWIVPPRGVPLRDRWEKVFLEANIARPEIPIECGSVITIRQILRRTDYLTILSPDQVAVELQAGWLAIVSNAPGGFTRTIGVTTRAGWWPTGIQSEFLDLLKRNARLQVEIALNL